MLASRRSRLFIISPLIDRIASHAAAVTINHVPCYSSLVVSMLCTLSVFDERIPRRGSETRGPAPNQLITAAQVLESKEQTGKIEKAKLKTEGETTPR